MIKAHNSLLALQNINEMFFDGLLYIKIKVMHISALSYDAKHSAETLFALTAIVVIE